MSENNTFRWLHFSDIHVGVDGQPTLWPQFSDELDRDLDEKLPEVGKIDVVIFSGDLVQSGKAEEFKKFDSIIKDIVKKIESIQTVPVKLICLPGNHDLYRPGRFDPMPRALDGYWSDDEFREHFWNDPKSSYMKYVNSLFKNFKNWQDSSIAAGLHLRPNITGLLVGDASYVFDIGTIKVGIASLNSTWLQIQGGDYQGKLAVDVRQIQRIVTDTVPRWVKSNDINLLVTHQPEDWLNHSAINGEWHNDINPPGLFDAHLFGHMHLARSTSSAEGGAPHTRSLQAASLFGLDKTEDGTQRTQGYSVNEIKLDGDSRLFTSWPRIHQKTDGRVWRLVRNYALGPLKETTGSYNIQYELSWKRAAVVSTPAEDAVCEQVQLNTDENEADSRKIKENGLSNVKYDLSKIVYPTLDARPYLNVRRPEQFSCVAAIKNSRVVWLETNWDMAEDSFISALAVRLDVPPRRVFFLDFKDFRSRDELLDRIRHSYDADLPTILTSISELDSSILVINLSDIRRDNHILGWHEFDIGNVIQLILEFSPNLSVIITTAKVPIRTPYNSVRIRAFDEVDTTTYINEHPLGGEKLSSPETVEKIYRHTDGVPTRIDAALRDLDIVSLQELPSLNPDLGDTTLSKNAAPAALVDSVRTLRRSKEDVDRRANRLLVALSAFPQGEQLDRVRNFVGTQPFMHPHALELSNRSLIANHEVPNISDEFDPSSPVLLVSRPVREHVRDLLDADARLTNDELALELYFGKDWRSGSIKGSSTCARVRYAICDEYEMQNAVSLILRRVRYVIEDNDEIQQQNSIRLASTFVRTLIDGNHFRNAAVICEDMIRLLRINDNNKQKITFFQIELAVALRMLGRVPAAQDVLRSIEATKSTKEQRQRTELESAFCYKNQGFYPESIEAAKRALAVDNDTVFGLHARVVMSEMSTDAAKKERDLKRLLSQSRRHKYTIMSNNIAIALSNMYGISDERSKILLRGIVDKSGRQTDFYNGVRAITSYVTSIEEGERIREDHKRKLMDAYQFCHKERLPELFIKCHRALWKLFEKSGETDNLISLFRHSSFIWRLNLDDKLENEYIDKIKKIPAVKAIIMKTNKGRDAIYLSDRLADLGISLRNHELSVENSDQ